MKGKPLSKLNMSSENAVDSLRKSECKSLQNFAIVFSTPEKLTSRDFWNSRKKKKATFQAKMCFEKMLWGISEMVIARAFKPLPLCSTPLETY